MSAVSKIEGVVEWLDRDLRISMADERHGVVSLNTLSDSRVYDRLSLDDPSNLVGQKILNHIGRIPLWLGGVSEAKPDEQASSQAKFLFGALKRASGTIKNVVRFQYTLKKSLLLAM